MITGITRIRNEESIISNTLDHVAKFVNNVIVYDDCSTDNTVEICENHPIVKYVIKGEKWESNPIERNKAEGVLRHKVYALAKHYGAEWVYYFDADEYVEMNQIIDWKFSCYYFRLFDFYITPTDVNVNYLDREWMGPEYRDIPMLFRTDLPILFTQRIPRGLPKEKGFGGYVKHYGKAISVKHWEETCDYYINYRWKGVNPYLQERWLKRKGKAIHIKSDFGNTLINWEDRKNQDLIMKLTI